MASGNVCWGIELGAYAIKAIKLERSGDDVNVLEYAVIPHKKPLSTPDADPADTLRVSMGQLVSQFDLTGAPISISIPGHSAFARFAKLPPVEPKKIPDIVKFEAVQQIPFPIDQVEWDYQTFASPDNPDVEVGIFAVMRERVMDILNKWHEVGISPEMVTIGPVAAYNAVAWDQNFGDKTPGTVILDIGTTATDLLVCEPGRVWVRTFQIGGHQFTEALVNAFKLSYSKAETLKQQAEQSKHARHILQAMRPVFGDIAQEVQRSIGYYQSSHRDANLTRLIALGSTFNLPGLRKYLGQQLQMEVIRLEKFNRLGIDGPRGAEFEAATGSLATAYGLALQGLNFQHGIMVNLMPVTITRETVWQKKTKWFALAACLSVAGAGVAFFKPLMEKATVTKPQDKPAAIGQVASRIQNLKKQWRDDVESKFSTDYRAANVAILLANRGIYPHILDDLGQVLASAHQKAEADKLTPPTFISFNTDYAPPAGQIDPATGQPTASPDAPTGPVPVGAKVLCTLEVSLSTTNPAHLDTDRFINESTVAWLKQHADRAGVPYTLGVASNAWSSESKVDTSKPGDTNSAPPPPSMQQPISIGGAGGRGGMLAPVPDAPPPMSDGGAPPPPPSQGTTNLDSLAPLPPMPPSADVGKTIVTYKIRFDAVIKAPDKPEAKEGKS
ncbi:MAG TPA: type IV pilus assembly protein PilM [Phycisphaerales bacterium]|nr:type IV pilus assembly protein PilM [Phycisphaerales bacterium]